MNEELIITNEDIELLKEMKNNCLKADVYNDEKRLLKANAITKFLMLEQENKELHNKIDKAIEYLKDRIQVLEVSYSYDKNDEYLNAKLFGGKKELEMLLNEVLKDSDVDD